MNAPSERYGHALSYDSGRGVTVLFGGRDDDGNRFNDTWEWNGASWTQRNPAESPLERELHALA